MGYKGDLRSIKTQMTKRIQLLLTEIPTYKGHTLSRAKKELIDLQKRRIQLDRYRDFKKDFSQAKSWRDFVGN